MGLIQDTRSQSIFSPRLHDIVKADSQDFRGATVIGASAFSLVVARQNADLIISENMSEFNHLH